MNDVSLHELPARSTLTIDLFSSLDGYAAAGGWPGYWGKEGPDLMGWLADKLADDHTLVMGANTYRTMSHIVAEAEDPTFARMAEIPKVVFSSTLQPPLAWANTQVVAEDAASAVRRMKADGTAPIRTVGSISLNGTLLREGLVDYLQVVVFPVITGETGLDPIYAAWPDLDLELVDSRTLDGRMQLLRYIPTIH